jgi:hypothetical protein
LGVFIFLPVQSAAGGVARKMQVSNEDVSFGNAVKISLGNAGHFCIAMAIFFRTKIMDVSIFQTCILAPLLFHYILLHTQCKTHIEEN